MKKIIFSNKIFRLIGLGLLIIMGQIYPVLFHYKYQSEVVTALNLTPHNTVFAFYPFFSDIQITLDYPDHSETRSSVELYNATNIYSGKFVYSLFYMGYIYKSDVLRDNMIRWYFCTQKKFNSTINYNTDLRRIRISYVHRRTHEVAETREIYCRNNSK